MATDGPTPPDCDQGLYYDGAVAGVYATAGACHFEWLIKNLSQELEVPIDWHYVGGRAVVVCWPKDLPAIKPYIDNYIKPMVRRRLEERIMERLNKNRTKFKPSKQDYKKK